MVDPDDVNKGGGKLAAFLPDIPVFIVVILFLLYATVVVALVFRPVTISGEAGTLLTALVALLTGSVAQVVNFYFGTSKQSVDKDKAEAAANVGGTDVRGPPIVSRVDVAGDMNVERGADPARPPPAPPMPPAGGAGMTAGIQGGVAGIPRST